MWQTILFYWKFTIKIKAEVLSKAPCPQFNSWVLIEHKERSGCQGDWYEYLFYSKRSKKVFYATTDLYISGSGRTHPISEFNLMDEEYKNNVFLHDFEKIKKIGSLL
jgi:hypothetical protein